MQPPKGYLKIHTYFWLLWQNPEGPQDPKTNPYPIPATLGNCAGNRRQILQGKNLPLRNCESYT